MDHRLDELTKSEGKMGVLWEFSLRKRFPYYLCSLKFPIIISPPMRALCVASLFHMQVEAGNTRSERDNNTNGKSKPTQGKRKLKKKERED
jgi:hypothetical protein